MTYQARQHRLLPHERWSAAWMLRRQQTHRTPPILRIEYNYGPEGIALFAAALVTVLSGMAIICVGVVLLYVANFNELPLQAVSNWLIVAGILLILPSYIRLIQAARAGKAFRGGRPFLRPPAIPPDTRVGQTSKL